MPDSGDSSRWIYGSIPSVSSIFSNITQLFKPQGPQLDQSYLDSLNEPSQYGSPSVIENVFGDGPQLNPNTGVLTTPQTPLYSSSNAYQRFEELNPPTNVTGVLNSVGDWFSSLGTSFIVIAVAAVIAILFIKD